MSHATILWLRKAFRLADNPSLVAALEDGGPVIPVAILDDVVAGWGAAPRWRWGKALAAFAETLEAHGSRLVLRRGDPLDSLRDLAKTTGAERILWDRQYDAASKDRDAAVKAALEEDGLEARSVAGHLMSEPWALETGSGGPYRVYSPFKNAFFDRADVGDPLAAPSDLAAPDEWPESDDLATWALGADMNRGGEIVGLYANIGEAAARSRLQRFLEQVDSYDEGRNRPDRDGTSDLSENFAWGEISARTVWHAVREHGSGKLSDGARTYLQELVWREFAYHLLHHYPGLPRENWRDKWDQFPWRDDNDDAERWRRGMTGLPFVDAALRQLYATGRMHNRLRMLTGSVLTKHMLTHWRIGCRWFEECLIDWDPASNSMGWQWVAGSGPDATPFFRIFNPETQRDKFDPQGDYVRRWVAEKAEGELGEDALAFFRATPRSWGLSPDQEYPAPVVGLSAGRQRALEAYEEVKKAS